MEDNVRGLTVEQLRESKKRRERFQEGFPKAAPAPRVESIPSVARDIDVVLMQLEMCVYRSRHDLAASWHANTKLDRLGFEEVGCDIG
jgi:hypothetical protein